jgi:hypothetical protein
MGLAKSPKLTTEYILSQIDEASIFGYYFGNFSLGKTYNSVFRKDNNPSTGFYISESGRIIYNDIATSEKLDCFAFVAKKFNLTYSKALLKVACDFGIIKCEGVTPISISEITKNQLLSEEIKKETVIKIQPDYWTPSYLKFWEDYSITQKELEDNKVYPVKKLFINDVLIPNFSKNVRYAYILEHEKIIYKKIYNPYATNKKFKWVSNIPLYMPFGITDLPFISDTLIITKAQKDRLIFKKYFSDVIALQNESPASMRDKTFKYLKKRYKRIFINTDLDEAGLNALNYYTELGCEPLMLPDVVWVKHNIKDVGDFVKHFGIQRFESFLKYKNLI